jgi:hypothetical protein
MTPERAMVFIDAMNLYHDTPTGLPRLGVHPRGR